MSKAAYEALMAAGKRQDDAFLEWMKKNGLTFDGDSKLVDEQGNKYDSASDFVRANREEQ